MSLSRFLPGAYRAIALAGWLMLALAGAGCGLVPAHDDAPTASSAAPTLDRNSYRLGAGDRIRVDVYGEPDLSAEETITAAGTINYPLLGRISTVGLTLKELEGVIAKRLREGYLKQPSVRATILLFRPLYVIGQVHRPGSYPYNEGLTVEKAIALAGGMTQIASTRKIYVLRESSANNQREKVQLGTPVFPGDTIVIEESLF